ncbi:TolC family protein [Vibrio crassostreae]|uniref:TolC family protein n=1 Tax=Vibrio crassostreae TaxID=246167 RepID=UPI0006307E61|nr:TolC family protein [Vibrio crassostreae]TCO05882.1 outer membrane protein TolC [Vibrio crassostreae]CAK1966616.1 putative Integral outer membrane protein TolC, efflux pump component [Vibrio crassostreae]CAK2158941.1 putative Integral outer membrane protein TolC, efflux pump component [Vibrio crassostreae]CAK2162969.1 putative Integral outer membrane protein TolC, efflux pump component [Vibrio crassostreae]CAK2175868.1 putative Integral outer membrane protein TolC, efflux pump component [Vi
MQMTKPTFRRLAIASILIGAISSPSYAAPLTFSEAWQILQENNNSLAAQQANVERYQHLQNATGSLNLPSVTLGANYTHLDSDVTINGEQFADSLSGVPSIGLPVPPQIISALGGITSTITEQDIFSSSIRAVWPIFTGGRITAAQNAAEGKSEEAQSQLLMEKQARYEDLSKYYFSVILAEDVVRTRQAVETGLTQHRDFAIKLEQQGQIARVERLQADASLDKAIVERTKAQNDLKIAQLALTQILGQNESVEPSEQLFINKNLPHMDVFIDQTLMTYPGLKILDAKEKQASSLIKAEKGKYYPEVYLYGDYSLYEDDSLASEMKPDWLVGIGVNVPLIDTSGRSDKVAAAHSAVSQVQFLKSQAKQDLTVLVQKTYLEANQAIDEVQGLNSSLSLAQENLFLRKKAFTQGLSNSLEVVDAELYLASIKTQQSAARFKYLISLNKLLALTSEMNAYSSYLTSSVTSDFDSKTDTASQSKG